MPRLSAITAGLLLLLMSASAQGQSEGIPLCDLVNRFHQYPEETVATVADAQSWRGTLASQAWTRANARGLIDIWLADIARPARQATLAAAEGQRQLNLIVAMALEGRRVFLVTPGDRQAVEPLLTHCSSG